MIFRPDVARSALCWLVAILLGACATDSRPVVDRLDENTGVTVTYSRTPFVFTSGETAESFPQIDVVQLGAIEVNRMGALTYYLWLGVTEYRFRDLADGQPTQFRSIVIDVGTDEIELDVLGWSHDAIGTSEPVYRRLFESSIDAYYRIDLERIEQLANAGSLRIRTGAPDPREYTTAFGAEKPTADLIEFVRVVAD